MKKIIFNCDICGNEFPPQEYSFLTGQIIKMNEKLEKQNIIFEGHYCGVDTNKLLEEVTKLKNATQTRQIQS